MSRFMYPIHHSIWMLCAATLLSWSAATGLLAQQIFVCEKTCKSAQKDAANGSKDQPWPKLSQALAHAKQGGGDTIALLSGHYGQVTITNHTFPTPITIRPAPGAEAHFELLHITGSENIIFQGLHVWPIGPPRKKHPLIRATTSTRNLIFQDMELRSHKSARSYMRWSKETWRKRGINGIETRGAQTTIKNNTLWGLGIPIITLGAHTTVAGNTIKGFSGDGMVGLGDHSTFVGNRVQDCVDVNTNHDDGFQSWSLPPGQGVITGLVLERNMILEWTGRKSHPLRCKLQGIGLFDGTYKNLTIRNNLVAVTAYHGIAVYGADGVSITHNTVVDTFGDIAGFPWILVSPHKNKTPSKRITLANNLAMSYNILPPHKARFNPLLDANMVIRHPFGVFMNPKKSDFRLKPDASAQNAGRAEYAPQYDLSGQKRPANQQPDVGAYQTD